MNGRAGGRVRREAAGGGPGAHLPAGIPADGWASHAHYLAMAARFETERLLATTRATQQTAAAPPAALELSADPSHLDTAAAEPLRMVAVDAGGFVDGIGAELRDRLLAVANDNGDAVRWRQMLEVDRGFRVEVPYRFACGATPITNGQFAAFVDATGYRTSVARYRTGWGVTADAQWYQGVTNDWDHQVAPMSAADRPVVQISWFDAMHYALWLGARNQTALRLPTKDEWLLAAHADGAQTEALLFPWGNSLEAGAVAARMNLGSAELAQAPVAPPAATGAAAEPYPWRHSQIRDGHALTSPVTAYPPNGRGIHDLLGNVWEWLWTTEAAWQARPRAARVASVPALAALQLATNPRLTMLGGCYLARLSHANLHAQMAHPALDGAVDIGFRLVAARDTEPGWT